MRKNLIFSMIAGLLLTGLLSFTLIGNNRDKAITFKKTVVIKAKKFACACVISNLHPAAPGSTTFIWTSTPHADHYTYGGYYQAGGTFSGTAYSETATIPYKSGGGRFNVTAICADGTPGTSQNVLF